MFEKKKIFFSIREENAFFYLKKGEKKFEHVRTLEEHEITPVTQ